MPTSITEWLDGLNAGFGASYTSSFSEYGIETVEFLRAVGEKEMAALEPLLVQAGAKPMHVKVIADAIAAAGTAIAPHAPGGPASSGTSPLKARVAVKGGKQFTVRLLPVAPQGELRDGSQVPEGQARGLAEQGGLPRLR